MARERRRNSELESSSSVLCVPLSPGRPPPKKRGNWESRSPFWCPSVHGDQYACTAIKDPMVWCPSAPPKRRTGLLLGPGVACGPQDRPNAIEDEKPAGRRHPTLFNYRRRFHQDHQHHHQQSPSLSTCAAPEGPTTHVGTPLARFVLVAHTELHRRCVWLRPHASPPSITTHPSHVSWPPSGAPSCT